MGDQNIAQDNEQPCCSKSIVDSTPPVDLTAWKPSNATTSIRKKKIPVSDSQNDVQKSNSSHDASPATENLGFEDMQTASDSSSDESSSSTVTLRPFDANRSMDENCISNCKEPPNDPNYHNQNYQLPEERNVENHFNLQPDHVPIENAFHPPNFGDQQDLVRNPAHYSQCGHQQLCMNVPNLYMEHHNFHVPNYAHVNTPTRFHQNQDSLTLGNAIKPEPHCKAKEIFYFLETCVREINTIVESTTESNKLSSLYPKLEQVAKNIEREVQDFSVDFSINEHKNHRTTFCDAAKCKAKGNKKGKPKPKSKKTLPNGNTDAQQNGPI